MSYCEKDFQVMFGRKNKMSGFFELKIVKTKSYRFDQLQPHQRHALLNAQGEKGCYHKLSDMSWEKKPVDCFLIRNYPSYVVIMFYEPRKRKMVYYVPIQELVALEGLTMPKKSVREEDIAKIAKSAVDYLQYRT